MSLSPHPLSTTPSLLVLLAAIAIVGFFAVRVRATGARPGGRPVAGRAGDRRAVPGAAARRADRQVLLAVLAIAGEDACGWVAASSTWRAAWRSAPSRGAWVVWRVTCGPTGERTSLVSDREFIRFLSRRSPERGLPALVAAATSARDGVERAGPRRAGDRRWRIFACQLVVVPFFLQLQDRPTLAPRAEVAALWATTVARHPARLLRRPRSRRWCSW